MELVSEAGRLHVGEEGSLREGKGSMKGFE